MCINWSIKKYESVPLLLSLLWRNRRWPSHSRTIKFSWTWLLRFFLIPLRSTRLKVERYHGGAKGGDDCVARNAETEYKGMTPQVLERRDSHSRITVTRVITHRRKQWRDGWRRWVDARDERSRRSRKGCCRCATGTASPALRDSQPTGETRANKSPQLPPVRAICLDGRLMPDIIHPGNNTLLPNEV